MSEGTPWLKSKSFDLTWIIGPSVFSVFVAIALKDSSFSSNDFLTWIILVVGIDVTHVYATLFRTYMHPGMRKKLGTTLLTVPLMCCIAATLLHAMGSLVFWRAMAYVAVFHFMRQQEGFLRLYQRHDVGNELKIVERVTIMFAMIAPLAYWHTHLPREFHWFVPDDFVAVPWAWITSASYILLLVSAAAWFVWSFKLGAIRGGAWQVRAALITSTFLAWNFGIVLFDDEFIFSVTNILSHGIPYMALIWVVGHRERPPRGESRVLETIFSEPQFYLAALLGLFCVALAEEFLWRSAPSIQRGSATSGEWETLGVAILAVPQLTHYILDGIIWKRRFLDVNKSR